MAKFLSEDGLRYFYNQIKSKFAPASHNHSAGNITSGTLPIARGGTGATSVAAAIKALLGTSAIGSSTKPLYYDGAALKACADSIGGGGIVAQLLEQNGYVKFANGLILQWGKIKANSNKVEFVYPLQINELLSISLIREQDYDANSASAFLVRTHDNTKAILNLVTASTVAYAYVFLVAI